MRCKAIVGLAAVQALWGGAAQAEPAEPVPFSVVEATIPGMLLAMQQGRSSSREIVRQSLARIARDRRLHAVIALNPRALEEAGERDRERARGQLRGPLHGIPIAVKDSL